MATPHSCQRRNLGDYLDTTTLRGTQFVPWDHLARDPLRGHRLIGIGIPIINLRRSSDRLRFITGIPIPAWHYLCCGIYALYNSGSLISVALRAISMVTLTTMYIHSIRQNLHRIYPHIEFYSVSMIRILFIGFLLWLEQWHCMPKLEVYYGVNILRPRQNGWHFSDDTFKNIFLNENIWISINISLNFVPKGPINNIPTLI